jgi:hypothetical protein
VSFAEVEGKPAVRITDGHQVLRLAALEDKIQWDPKQKHARSATGEEREAY